MFSESARIYLDEACEELSNRIEELKNETSETVIPEHLMRRLSREQREQDEKLKRKLIRLCANSSWNSAGKAGLVTNLSDRQLSETEIQALSLGLKFDTGITDSNYSEYVCKNYKWKENDVDKGFKQGVVACFQALADEEKSVLPRRYREALKKLGKCENIVITQADKGGGVVVLNKNEYVNKMMDLLSDGSTYERKHVGFANSEAEKFKIEARKILRKTAKGKKLIGLLEEAPRPPRMRGLPKVHKPGIPMRPITSGVGSVSHRLAKCLAKPLSGKLGTVSDAHLKNSSDLIMKLKKINFADKKLASFDVKALFTNVPVGGAMSVVKRVVSNISDSDLPVNKKDYVKLVSMCVNFGSFIFNEQEYKQIRGLAMGSALSPVMACLYMEHLEDDKFKRIMGRGSHWYRYVDDVLVIMPHNTRVNDKLSRLNRVDSNIEFTVELEEDGKLPFLDTIIHRIDNSVKFSVYRKPTNKDDFVHYLSAHNERTKRGVVIGFFLRANRICSPEFLEEEFKYIVESFKKLKYPIGLLYSLKNKATEIASRVKNVNIDNDNSYLLVPHSKKAVVIDKMLSKAGMKIAYKSGKKIRDFVKHKSNKSNNEKSVVYKIPCNSCPKSYYGETSRGMQQRLYEHKNDVRQHRTSNSLVVHIDSEGHLPNWGEAKILHKGLNKMKRRTVEAAYIATENIVNHREGFVNLGKVAGRLVVRSAGCADPGG